MLTEHLDQRFTIDELSKRYLINTSTLKEVFKTVYGLPIASYMKEYRIRQAMFHKATDNDPPRLAKIMGRIPAKTVGDPMDVGMCAAFLCSDAARYISGTCIPVDGGALIGF